MKRTHTTCRGFDVLPWAIRWRLHLADWFIRHDLLSYRLGFWLQRGVARADARRWSRKLR